jgi:Gpi18-like mannosyltransferase
MTDSRNFLSKYDVVLKYLAFLLLIIAFFQAIYVHLITEIVPYDDAYITYRYIDNLFSQHGLVYNKGEYVFGSTTPFYVIWLSFLKFSFSSISVPVLSVRFNLIFFLSTATGIFLIFRSVFHSIKIASFFAFLFLINKHMLNISVGGMEVFLFTTFVCLVIWSLLEGKIYPAAFMSSIACLVRPEGVFCVIALLIYLGLNKEKRKNLSYLRLGTLLFVLPLLWSLFAIYYYGSIIPQSVIAKSKPIYPLPPDWARGKIFLYLILSVFPASTFFFKAFSSGISSTTSLLELLSLHILSILFVVLGISGFFTCKPILKKNIWIIPFLFVSIIAFYSISNPLMFAWYYALIFVLWLLVLFPGIIFVAKSNPKFKVFVFCSLLLIVSNYIWINKPTFVVDLIDPGRLRTLRYKEAALYLNRIKNIDSLKIAAPEIGALGYYSKAFILDACGLVTPEAVPLLPVPADQRVDSTVGAISVDFVKLTKPDFVVTMEIFARESLLKDKWFYEKYLMMNGLSSSYLYNLGKGNVDLFIFKNRSLNL